MARLSSFANSLSLNLKWKLKQDKNLCVAECTIGDMQAMAVYRKKRTAKLLAAKNMLKVIDGNQNMKTKLINFLYGNNVGKPLNETSTNLSLIKDMKFTLKSAVKTNSCSKSILDQKYFQYGAKPKEYSAISTNKSSKINYDEPQEILKWFQSLDNCISTDSDEMAELKEVFDDVSSVLKMTLENYAIQLIPIGSFVIGCLRKSNNTIDSYLHLDHISMLNCSEMSRLYEEKKFGNDCPDELFYKYGVQIEKDPLNLEEYILFRSSDGVNKVRVFLMSLGSQSGTRLMNHYTAGIYHSNWLVQNLTQGSNNLSTIRLFRLVREWKSLRNFHFLPCEILDLTLSYATFSFKENSVFKVLLKFFT